MDSSCLDFNDKDITLNINYMTDEWIKIAVHPRMGSIIHLNSEEDEKTTFQDRILTDPKAAIRYLQATSIMSNLQLSALPFIIQNDVNVAKNSTAISVSISENSNDYILIDVDDDFQFVVSACIAGQFEKLDPCVINVDKWELTDNTMLLEIRKYAANASIFADMLSSFQDIDFFYIIMDQNIHIEDSNIPVIFNCSSIVLPTFSPISPIFINIENSDSTGKKIAVRYRDFMNAIPEDSTSKTFVVDHYDPESFFSSFFAKMNMLTSSFCVVKQCRIVK
jgi:hypothetical protein